MLARDIILRLSNGNPGAMMCLIQYFESPFYKSNPIKGQEYILFLEEKGIIGSFLYVLWNDRAEQNMEDMIVMIEEIKNKDLSGDKIREKLSERYREAGIDYFFE